MTTANTGGTSYTEERKGQETMNNTRRKAVDAIHTELLGITLKLEEIESAIDEVQGEEAEARDNMPESLQDTDRYTELDEIAGALEDISYNVASARDELETELARLYDIVEGGRGWE